MQPGPIPPHERTWRHPSEVAAEERALLVGEGTPRSTRVLALTTGAAGLLAIGVLMVTITPRGVESPVAIASTTSISAQAAVVPPSPFPTPFGLRSDSRPAARADADVRGVLATPIGDGRFALVTRASLRHDSSPIIDLRLPSGRSSTGSIVMASADAVVVALLTAGSEHGHPVAHRMPRSSEIVTVLATPPFTVPLYEVARLDVEEGTAVLDGSEALIGLCSHADDGSIRLIEVDGALDAATSVVP